MRPSTIFDQAGALSRVCGDKELLCQLFEMLQDQAEITISEIHSSLGAADLETTHRKAHHLKGALANLGACSAQNVARDLELAARSGDKLKAETLIHILEGEIESFYLSFRSFQDSEK
jgi:HPt (histidine-containing phosphotransfer) domain-containing protein